MAGDNQDQDESELRKQREASIKFGRMALQATSLEETLEKACELTAAALGTDLSKIMEFQPEDNTLLVVAGHGWRDGVVGEERVPAVKRSSEGYALRTGKPAISEDAEEEDRFDYADFLKRHGVEAIVNVVIPGEDGRPPFGLLQVDSRKPREFIKEDIEFLQSYANLVGAAVERHRYHDQLTEALRVQKRLYDELKHRVMNNISVITGLLRLKAGRTAHPVAKQEISDVLKQIDVLQEIYKQLHASTNVDEIDLGGYLAALASNIVSFAQDQSTTVRIETDHDTILVNPSLGVNLGLVVNEFVTNSIKHAPSGHALVVTSRLRRENQHIRLILADNGKGLGDALKRKDGASGSGLGLIDGLLTQIGSRFAWHSETGTQLQIDIPITPNKLVPATR